jgi:hypothetical protein
MREPLNSWVVAMHSYQIGLGGWHDESIREAERAVAPLWDTLRTGPRFEGVVRAVWS